MPHVKLGASIIVSGLSSVLVIGVWSGLPWLSHTDPAPPHTAPSPRTIPNTTPTPPRQTPAPRNAPPLQPLHTSPPTSPPTTLALINHYRQQAGCVPLRIDLRLTHAALLHSSD